MTYTVAAFYHFADLHDYEQIKPQMVALCQEHDIKGTVLLATEGINGTIAGSEEAIQAYFDYLHTDERLKDLKYKVSHAQEHPFKKLKIKLRNEIVRMDTPSANGFQERGTYVKPEDWDALISAPDVVVVDTRNGYEYEVGTFENAVNPNTTYFRELPQWVDENLDPAKHKKVAMFCTGGIRCEKSTVLMKQKGFKDVYHLDGGILQYLEDTGNKNKKWNGTCFVFDERATVDDTLAPTRVPCPECSKPMTTDEIKYKWSPETGVRCEECAQDEIPNTSPAQDQTEYNATAY